MKQNPFTSLLRAPRLVLAMSSLAALPLLAADPAAVVPDESVAYIEMDSQAIYKLEDHPVTKTLPLKDLEKLFYKMTGTSADDQAAMEKLLADEMGMSYEELKKKWKPEAAPALEAYITKLATLSPFHPSTLEPAFNEVLR